MWLVYLDISLSFTDAFIAGRELGAKIFHLSLGSSVSSKEGNGFVHKSEVVEHWDVANVLGLIKQHIPTQEQIAVWTLDDCLVPLAAELNEALNAGASYPSPKAVWATKNKLLLRQCLEGTGLNPWYGLLRRNDAYVNPLPGTAVVVKPLEGYSSIGVELLPANASDEKFATAAAQSFSVLDRITETVQGNRPDFVPSAQDTLLVESFVDGAEYSVEVFVTNKDIHFIGICGKSPMLPPYFEEISYMMPAAIDKVTEDRLCAAAKKTIAAIGLTTGMVHVELKDGSEGARILDIGLRLGGDGLTHDLIKTAFGLDMVRAVLAELLGLPTEDLLQKKQQNRALLFLLQVGSGGHVTSIPNPEQIKDLYPVVRMKCFVKVGDTLTPYPAYSGTPGFALFQIPSSNDEFVRHEKEVVDACLSRLTFSYATEPAYN